MRTADGDISGFLFEEPEASPASGILISDTGLFRVHKMWLGGCWRAVKSVGAGISAEWGRAMLEKEFRILSSLSHRSVVTAVSLSELPELGMCLVMEWVEGLPLDKYLASNSLSPKKRQALIGELIESVAYIHSRSVAHRDIKPSNILVDESGHIRLIDFGLADRADEGLLKSVTGTAGYSAPEVSEGVPEIDWLRADVYSLGVVIRQIKGSVSSKILARRCMNRIPGRRPEDGNRMRVQLKRIRRRLRTAAVAAVVVPVAVAVAIGAGLYNNKVSDRVPSPVGLVAADSAKGDSIAAGTIEREVDTASQITSLPVEKSVKAPEQDIQSEQTATVPVNINYVLLRAADIRDSLYLQAKHRGEPLDTLRLDRMLSDLRAKAARMGATPDELRHYDAEISSARFNRVGAIPKFCFPK